MGESKQALVLIDIQQGVVPPAELSLSRSTPSFEQNVARLLDAFRSAPSADILHVRHHSAHEASQLHSSKLGVEVLPCASALDSELVITKSASCSFVGTDLEKEIRNRGIDRVVFCGTTTEHCVSTTVRMAADLKVVDHAYGISGIRNPKPGRIVVVSDATAMYENKLSGKKYDVEVAHEISLASLKDEFCDVETTEEVISKLQRGL